MPWIHNITDLKPQAGYPVDIFRGIRLGVAKNIHVSVETVAAYKDKLDRMVASKEIHISMDAYLPADLRRARQRIKKPDIPEPEPAKVDEPSKIEQALEATEAQGVIQAIMALTPEDVTLATIKVAGELIAYKPEGKKVEQLEEIQGLITSELPLDVLELLLEALKKD